MIKKHTLIFLMLFTSIIAYGQINESTIIKEFNLELGYQNLKLYDKNVSPLIYFSNSGGLRFGFEKTKTNTLSIIGGSAYVGSNQSQRFGKRSAIVYDAYTINGHRDSTVYEINPDLSFIQANLYYSFYWELNTKKSKMHMGVTTKNDFYYSALGADTWFFNQLSIMPSYRVEYPFKSKSKIEAELSSPIFSYILRQPYALDPSLPENSYFKANLKTASSLRSLNKFQQVNIKLKYFYPLKNGRQIGLSYYFMWMNYSNITDRNLGAYSNSILFSYKF